MHAHQNSGKAKQVLISEYAFAWAVRNAATPLVLDKACVQEQAYRSV